MVRVRFGLLLIHTIGVALAALIAWVLAGPVASIFPFVTASTFRLAALSMLVLYWLYEGWVLVSGKHKAAKFFERRGDSN